MPKAFFGNQAPAVFGLTGDHFEKQTLIRATRERHRANEGLGTYPILNSLIVEKTLNQLDLTDVRCDEYSLEIELSTIEAYNAAPRVRITSL